MPKACAFEIEHGRRYWPTALLYSIVTKHNATGDVAISCKPAPCHLGQVPLPQSKGHLAEGSPSAMPIFFLISYCRGVRLSMLHVACSIALAAFLSTYDGLHAPTVSPMPHAMRHMS